MISKKKLMNDATKKNLHKLSDEERILLRETLLSMTQEIDKICRKHGIKIFLAGGSLLGAIRHNGFIPWDDDMDFGMMREDYKKFINIFDEELGDKYYLRCPNSRYPHSNRFMQIFKKDTILDTADDTTPMRPKCIFIDIFPYDYVPNNILIRTLKGLFCNFLMIVASAVTNRRYPNKDYDKMMLSSKIGAIILFFEKIIGFLFSWKNPIDWFNVVDSCIQHKKKTQYITSATGRRHYLGEMFDISVFLPLGEHNFENLKLYIPAKPEVYLKNNYGAGYMAIPPQKDRESHLVKEFKA